MSIAALIRSMAAAGAPAEAIAIAVEAIENVASKDVQRRASQAERKQRQRQRERDSHATVTGQSQDDTVPPSPLVPPLDGFPKPLPKSPPIIPPSDINSGENPPVKFAQNPKPPKAPSRFDEFWQTYPKRDGSNPKEPARQKFEQACKRGDDQQAIIDGAARYAEQQKRLGNIGTPYVKQAATWLNAKGWADDYGSPSKSQSPPVNEKAKALIDRLPEHQLLDYVKRYAIGRFTWNADVFGPPPNSPNTLVPPQILKQAKEGIAA